MYPIPANGCGLLGLLQSGLAFDQTILADLAAVKNTVSTMIASIANLPNVVVSIAIADANALAARLTAVLNGAIASMEAHLIAQFSGLLQNLDVAAGQLAAQVGLQAAGCGLPSLGNTGATPCPSLSGMFGSLMGAGSAAIGQLTGFVNSATATVAGLTQGVLTDVTAAMSSLTAGIGQIEQIGAQLTSMVTGEVAALANAVTDVLSLANVSSLLAHSINPCTMQVLQAVGSPNLRGMLSL